MNTFSTFDKFSQCFHAFLKKKTWCFIFKNIAFNSPKIDLCRHVFADFVFPAQFVTLFRARLNVPDCTFLKAYDRMSLLTSTRIR